MNELGMVKSFRWGDKYLDPEDIFDEEFRILYKLYYTYSRIYEPRRDSPLFRKRWDSEYLIDLALNEGSFVSEYRVTPRIFNMLVELLTPQLQVNVEMAKRATPSGEISVASRIGIALIFLGGGRYMEAMRTHGVAKSTVFKCFHEVLIAILGNPLLSLNHKCDEESLKNRAAQFEKRSSHHLFKYVTGCIDGIAIKIKAPSRRERRNQSIFFNKYKKYYSLNMQGVCDANYHFIGVSCKHTGRTGDQDAFENSTLKNLNALLYAFFPFHWLADGGYGNSETMMSTYDGINSYFYRYLQLLDINLTPDLEAFNFFHAQLRICIECAFGILVNRWGILWRKLGFSLNTNIQIVMVCCLLHNICTQNKIPILNRNYLPPEHVKVDENGRLIDPTWKPHCRVHIQPNIDYNSGSTLREFIVDEIKRNAYRR